MYNRADTVTKAGCRKAAFNTLPSTYQHPTNSYRGRSWLGVDKVMVSVLYLVYQYFIFILQYLLKKSLQ